MKRIALDLDGVVYNYSATACYLMNHYRGYQLDWTQTQSWDWLKDSVTKEDWKWLWTQGVREGLFRYGHLVKGAAEGIKELAKLGRIVVVTSRPETAVQDTIDWISYIKIPTQEIHITRDNKASYKPDVAIDDGPHNIVDYTAAGIPCVLYVRKYNDFMVGKDPLIHSALTWNDIIEQTKKVLNG